MTGRDRNEKDPQTVEHWNRGTVFFWREGVVNHLLRLINKTFQAQKNESITVSLFGFLDFTILFSSLFFSLALVLD